MEKKIAIFASGNGTNAENIILHFRKSGVAVVALVVTNRRSAFVAQRAARLGVPCHYLPRAAWEDGTEVLRLLRDQGIDFIVLAGFLALVPPALVKAYPGRIVNIHPALLPRHGGKGMYGDHVHRAVIADGDTESGITIHLIDEHYDRGQTVFQATCPVLPGDTPDELAHRVHALEYEHFPRVIEELVRAL